MRTTALVMTLALLCPLAAGAAQMNLATLEVSVGSNGRATNVRVLDSSLSQDALDGLVRDAQERGYVLEMSHGRPVAGTVIYSIQASVEREGHSRCEYCPDGRTGQSSGF